MSKLYVTTAIPYMNAAPHIGHALDYLLADVYTRYQTLQGQKVRFQAGTDEHGNKIYQKALACGLSPQQFVDQNSAIFQDFIQRLGVNYTDFIRTTDQNHIRRAQAIWQKLTPHIYSSTYDGWYCEGCESFITQKEYDENHGSCPDHKTPYQKLTENNYYFRISDFKPAIKQAFVTGAIRILPEFRQKEILRLLDDSPDVSISRPISKLTWGIPVPEDQNQVMYVWIDALANYLTILGYPEQDISDFWPAAVQVVGKDILRFHAIIWLAMLLALDLPLPKVILSHGFILADGQKMSKSLGNVVSPLDILDRHGLDAFRYFFTRHIDTFADSDFTWEKFENAYNNELANDLGNLVQRLATLCDKLKLSGLNFTPQPDSVYQQLMADFEFTRAIDYAWTKLQDLNRRIDVTKPWAVIKEDSLRAEKLLTSLVQDLLQANHLLTPFLPITAQISEIFTASTITPPTTPLFPKS